MSENKNKNKFTVKVDALSRNEAHFEIQLRNRAQVVESKKIYRRRKKHRKSEHES